MTKKEKALIDDIEKIIIDETFNNKCKTADGILFLTKLSNLFFALKYPKLNTKNIEIQ